MDNFELIDKQRKNLAKNLCLLRKKFSLTQLELAEKFSYSDKAVSKWERGEAFPDVFVLKSLAEFYHVTLDSLFQDKVKLVHCSRKVKTFVPLLSVCLVWVLAVAVHLALFFLLNGNNQLWLSYIWAIPASFTVLTVFSALWFGNRYTFLNSSFLMWTLATAIYLTFPIAMMWMVFILCAPIQITMIFWFIFVGSKIKKQI